MINKLLSTFRFFRAISNNLFSFWKLIWLYIFSKISLFTKLPLRIQIDHQSQKIAVHLRAEDLPIFFEVFRFHCYQFFTDQLHNKSCIVDVGANVGLFALYLLPYLKNRDYKIICIEPSEDNLNLLRKNVGKNKNIEIKEGALVAKKGAYKLEVSSKGFNHKLIKSEKETHLTQIAITNLIKEVDGQNLYFKIDIEGFEEELFKGDIGWTNSIATFILETHSLEGKRRIWQQLESNGFGVEEVYDENLILAIKE